MIGSACQNHACCQNGEKLQGDTLLPTAASLNNIHITQIQPNLHCTWGCTCYWYKAQYNNSMAQDHISKYTHHTRSRKASWCHSVLRHATLLQAASINPECICKGASGLDCNYLSTARVNIKDTHLGYMRVLHVFTCYSEMSHPRYTSAAAYLSAAVSAHCRYCCRAACAAGSPSHSFWLTADSQPCEAGNSSKAAATCTTLEHVAA